MLAPSLSTSAWPPDYVQVFTDRQRRLLSIRSSPVLAIGAKEYYRTRALEFIEHWCVTYDPRLAGTGFPTTMPFVLFPRQREAVEFLCGCLAAQESGLVEKCRDVGVTWICCAFSVWLWLFWPGAAVGWGSRKESIVDKIGDPDSIFEKMRIIVRNLPEEFLPTGFLPDDHMSFMRFVNPETESTITGEGGDSIGRGGRKLIYFKDESAHYARPEMIEASLMDNTRCQVDVSSVNGLGNVFHRRREAGVEWEPGVPLASGRTNVFVFDWRDHPLKTQEWYEARRKKAEDDGLLHVFAQEIDRNYSSSVEGIVVPPEWVVSAIDAHKRIEGMDAGGWGAALDVADEGGDTNALVKRKGVVLNHLDEWGKRDTGATARHAVDSCKDTLPINLQYDCIGVGAGVKAETNRLKEEDLMPKGLRLVPWDAGDSVQDPKQNVEPGDRDTPLNEDFYQNLKAQAWWLLRRRFEKTHRFVTQGVKFSPDQLISIDSSIPKLRQLQKELSQPTYGPSGSLKMMIKKKPSGTRSPNLADAVVMCYCPAKGGSTYTLDNVH